MSLLFGIQFTAWSRDENSMCSERQQRYSLPWRILPWLRSSGDCNNHQDTPPSFLTPYTKFSYSSLQTHCPFAGLHQQHFITESYPGELVGLHLPGNDSARGNSRFQPKLKRKVVELAVRKIGVL